MRVHESASETCMKSMLLRSMSQPAGFFHVFQIGSYFGSALCSLDVDGDGASDLLLVGAPMFMSTLKKEQGRVYLFSFTKVGVLCSGVLFFVLTCVGGLLRYVGLETHIT